MLTVIRIAAAAAGIVLAVMYWHASLRVAAIDKVAEWIGGYVSTNFLATEEFNERLLADGQNLLGPEARANGKMRILFFSIPEEVTWKDGEDAHPQVHHYGETLPDPAIKSIYFPSSFRLSESYGAFLYSIDPDKTNKAPEWEAYRQIQRKVVSEILNDAGSAEPKLSPNRAASGVIALKNAPYPAAARDIIEARDAFQNDGNWLGDGIPRVAIVGNVSEWKKAAVASQVLLFRGSPKDVVIPGQLSTNGGSAPTHEPLTALAANDLQISAARYAVFQIAHGKWFNRAIVRKYGSGGYQLDGAPAWANQKYFGPDGILSLLPRAVIIAQRPTTHLRLAPSDFERLKSQLKEEAKVTIGGLVFSPSQVLSLDESSQVISMSGDESKVFVIGIVAEALP